MKQFLLRVKDLISYIPVIWNGTSGDYSSSIDIFKHSLKLLKRDILLHSELEGAEYHASRIDLVIKLMDKVYDDEYTNEWIDLIESKYGKYKVGFTPREDGLFEMYSYHEGLNPELLDEAKEFRRKTIETLHLKQEKAHRILWKLIDRHIQRWWY